MLDVETLGAALKLAKKGGGGGGEGGSGAVIDDSKISSSTTWSSQKIVDTLCPPFTTSGETVQCTPVANYPLDVQVEITPTQEGTGDPSPENVRPIVGWDAVNITRCGKNLLDMSDAYANGYNLTGFKNMLKPGMQYTYTVKSSGGIAFSLYAVTKANTPWGDGQLQLTTSYINEGKSETFTAPSNIQDFAYIALAGGTDGIGSVFPNVEFQLELGSASTSYEPYRGQTYTIPLGQTVYGGTLDVGTGTLTVTQVKIESYNGENLPGQWISDRDIYTPGTQPSIGAQVVYALAESQTIQLAPQQIIALSGTNTLFADAGNITVTGASDPIATITALQDRVSALESAALN